jgi:REP element-mobilizing transposase RayT
VVLKTLREVAAHRGWRLLAAHVRSNHVHVVVVAADAQPEKVLADFKAYASRRLREAFQETADRKRWTEHGSTRYLWKEAEVTAATQYVVDGQGTPLEVFQQSAESVPKGVRSEPEASARET